MTNNEIIVEIAQRLGWQQDDPGGGAMRFKIGGTVVTFMPDHEPRDVGDLIERMYALGCGTFRFEPAVGGVRAYFEDEAWAEVAPKWKSATTKAALRALREKKIGDLRQ